MTYPLGEQLPPGDEHAVSVSIPTWKDTESWAKRDATTLVKLKSGYPRFFMPNVVEFLAKWLVIYTESFTEQKSMHTVDSSHKSLLFGSQPLAQACIKYLQGHGAGPYTIFRVSFQGHIETVSALEASPDSVHGSLYAVTYPPESSSEASSFWQHTGYGISSRYAKYWLDNAPFCLPPYTKRDGKVKLPFDGAKESRNTLRRRIGDLVATDTLHAPLEAVFLYPSGMSAISHTAVALNSLRGIKDRACRVAVFGFLYVDTFKVLSKIHQFNCVLYGNGSPSELDALESDLDGGLHLDALYTEFPGNPLLGCVDLERLHRLSKTYNFFLVVDDTVATSVNVSLLSECDVVCTSLTKMFSGGCNVMGGSVILNPDSEHFNALQGKLDENFVDTYFTMDVLVMEENSADFESRVLVANRNAEYLVAVLRQHFAVAKVFYPKGNATQDFYEKYRRPERGYGFLLSIEFVRPQAAVAFYDALDVAKGPSLGTNFTLCCPYTLFAHYSELEWAAKFGVVEHLVRISVGTEDMEHLVGKVNKALSAAGRMAKV